MWDPFGASSSNVTSWKSGPNERGTLNILSTCVITLILCVYTCLHLNIPGPEQKTWCKRFQRKSLWLLAGLFAPEFVAYVAFYDWLLAKNHEVEMKRYLDPLTSNSAATDSEAGIAANLDQSMNKPSDQSSQGTTTRRHRWTRTHSYLALMGGFAFDMTEFAINFAPNQAKSLTLSMSGLESLAHGEPDLIPDVSEDEILDKSKADGFSKILVCIQASWFLIQCIGRLSAHYPISLLELNTFLHAVCCLLIYGAWWHKPLDIEAPYYIDSSKENAEVTCAWMIANSLSQLKYGNLVWARGANANITPNSLWSERYFTPGVGQSEEGVGKQSTDAGMDRVASIKAMRVIRKTELAAQIALSEGLLTDDKHGNFWRLYNGQKFCGHYLNTNAIGTPLEPGAVYALLARTDLECFRLAQRRHQQLGPLPTFYLSVGFLSYRASSVLPAEYELAMWPHELQRSLHTSIVVDPRHFYLFGAAVASAFYGGVHLIAWHNQFSSNAESIIWRTSCLLLVLPLVLSPFYYIDKMVYVYFNRVIPHMSRRHSSYRRQNIFRLWFRWSYEYPMTLIFLICAISYVAARIFLVVESFRNLGHLPEAVYKEPQWSTYIPHFGSG